MSPRACHRRTHTSHPLHSLLDNDDKPPLLKCRLGPGHGAPDNDMPKKQCRVTQLQPFHADLEAGIIALKSTIARELFEVKGKFPPALKPKLQSLHCR